ncbi:MAG: penicillin acylase family protein [Proteobacteria bacterium]|nr:penicillin acylase family protein [Pseudomonadota bacterium]
MRLPSPSRLRTVAGRIPGVLRALAIASGSSAHPQVEGRIEVEGLDGRVEVLRDHFGVPHIFAGSEADALFGQGFVHAQDRLFQMDSIRRVASGRVAEVVGSGALDADRFMRRLGLAGRAAERLESFGYGDVKILDGGVHAWAQAGFELFTGLNVPSKAFGEFIEETCGTPHIDAEELKRKIDAGEDLIILDARPMNEFQNMNIPGAIDCPGAELAYRIQDLAPSPETRIVVNCAGRTRSIIGAQTLINACVPNPVVALKNGTMGWHLTGFELEHGQDRPPPAVSGGPRSRPGPGGQHGGTLRRQGH